jgi:hypothetical protein
LASLLSKLTKDSNKLLVVHTMHLYKKHLADLFVKTQDDFGNAVAVICSYVADGSHRDDDPVFVVAASILEKYFDIYKEQTSEVLNIYLMDIAPKIFAILLRNIDQAVDVKYFDCIGKYVK